MRGALAGSGTIGTGPDVQIFLWGLRWWAYALEHRLDPLHSSLICSPYGTDVEWTTTVPLVSVLAVGQFLISPRVLTTMLVGGALAGLAAFALLPGQRAALRRATVWSAAGLAGAGVTLAPLLFTILRDGSSTGRWRIPGMCST